MLGVSTTSCEDMFTVDDELHTRDLAPKDTVYQMFGIINRMQKLVDRTVVLGELRADLVEVDPAVATTDLQNVMNNDIDTENEYNHAADYYAVINACNIYLTNVDSLLVSHNKRYYEKEIQACKVFRAWTYLELAKTYGRVPFVLEPVLSANAASEIVANASNRADMNDICSYFIEDLLPYASQTIVAPDYGNVGFTSTQFFIPSRLMLAELYLWRGCYTQNQDDFVEACRYYHDYFNYPHKYVTTGTGGVTWNGVTFENTSDGYTSAVAPGGSDAIAIIPLDTCAYDGTYSEIYQMFNSQYTNNYYVPVIPSERVRELSREQIYCIYRNENNRRDTIYSTQKTAWEDSIYKGDLRFSAVYRPSNTSDKYSDRFSKERQHIMKWSTSEGNAGPDQRIKQFNLYRKSIVWLHFAEALNRAGFPQTAFAVLKYGISSGSLNQYLTDTELMALYDVPSFFNGSLASWTKEAVTSNGSTSYTGFYTIYDSEAGGAGGASYTMKGIHSRGCGDSEYNDYYVLPRDSQIWAKYDYYKELRDSLIKQYNELCQTHEARPVEDDGHQYVGDYNIIFFRNVQGQGSIRMTFVFADEADSLAVYEIYNGRFDAESMMYDEEEVAYNASKADWQAANEKLILDEEALEGMFEGLRFYDLMRYAMYHGDKEFIADQVAKRKGSADYDSRADKLRGGNWYLPLPTK